MSSDSRCPYERRELPVVLSQHHHHAPRQHASTSKPERRVLLQQIPKTKMSTSLSKVPRYLQRCSWEYKGAPDALEGGLPRHPSTQQLSRLTLV